MVETLYIQDARRVSRGIQALEAHIAGLFLRRGAETLSAFLDAVPARGQALVDLFLESGKASFDDFVDAVIARKYFYYGVGWNAGEVARSLWSISFESTRLAILLVRTVPNMLLATFSGFLGAEEEIPESQDYGFGGVGFYTGEKIPVLLPSVEDPLWDE